MKCSFSSLLRLSVPQNSVLLYVQVESHLQMQGF